MGDTDERPITKDKLGKRVEFGHVLQVEEVSEGIITGYKVFKGNASDKTLLVDAIEHHIDLFKKRQEKHQPIEDTIQARMKRV